VTSFSGADSAARRRPVTTTVRFDADLWTAIEQESERLGVARAAFIRDATRERVARIDARSRSVEPDTRCGAEEAAVSRGPCERRSVPPLRPLAANLRAPPRGRSSPSLFHPVPPEQHRPERWDAWDEIARTAGSLCVAALGPSPPRSRPSVTGIG
jgi:hypothetical protein